MAIDLNGSATGLNYATTYLEEDAAVSIVAPGVIVGNGSSTSNSGFVSVIRLEMTSQRPGDQWWITNLPSSIVVATTETGPALSPPIGVDALANGVLFLRSTVSVTDVQWQAALLAVRYQTGETTGGSRLVHITAKGAFGIWSDPVTTQITVQPKNDAPQAQNDTAVATEAGDFNNSLPGVNATGNVLLNDTDADAGDTKTVSAVSFGAQAGVVGSALQGAFGTLTLNSGGHYTYAVNQNNAAVESLRTNQETLSDTFTYTVRDNAGATSTATLTVTIQGRNDAPIDLAVGQTFNGSASSVVVGGALMPADTDFSFELKVSPKNTITLNAATLSGASGMAGQAYAVAPEHGYNNWGSTDHAGVGLSVGTNGISVYQWTLNHLVPLLTWSGNVHADTHVTVVFNNKTPTLYVDGVAVATGLQSNKIIHPTARLGGISWGYFEGVISDYIVWNDPLTASQVAERATATELAEGATPAVVMATVNLAEDSAAGSLVATARARDKDAGDTLTYALTDDSLGRFVIDASTGAIFVAQNAQFDHETESTVHLQVRATDAAGLHVEKTFSLAVSDVNEAPQLTADSLDVSIGRLALFVDQSHQLWWVDLSSGQRSLIGTASVAIKALARTHDGVYYGINDTTLYIVNPANGQCTAVATLTGTEHAALGGLTAAGNGKLYAVDSVGNLREIDPQTGATQTRVALNNSVSSHGDAVFINGAIYWNTVWGELHRYELATGHHSTVLTGLPSSGGLSHISSLTAFSTHEIHAVDDTTQSIIRINLQTNTFALLDVPLTPHTTGQTLVDGTEVLAAGNVFANDLPLEAGDSHRVVDSGSGTELPPEGQWMTGTYGMLLIHTNGAFSYIPFAEYAMLLGTPGDTLVDNFTYTVSDSSGLTSHAELNVTLRGHTDAPTVAVWHVSAVEAGGVHNATPGVDPAGNLLSGAVDPSGADEALQVTRLVYNGSPRALNAPINLQYGTLQVSANGEYHYTVNQSHQAVEALRTSQQTLTEVVSFEVTGLLGTVRASTLTITIEGRDDAPIAQAASATAYAASGLNQGTPGHNPSGQLIHALTDVDDAPGSVRVIQVRSPFNVVRNGSFETAPVISGDGGWFTSAMPDWTNPAGLVNFLRNSNATDGRVTIDLDQASAVDSLQQTNIATQAGKSYQLQFDLAPRAGFLGTTVEVFWNNVMVGTATVSPSGWTTASFNVTATGNDTLRLAELASENDGGGPLIDNVRINQTGVAQEIRGQYGTLHLQEDGTYQYNVDQSSQQVLALRRAQDTLQETFDYTIADEAGLSTSSTLSFIIEGRNDAPTAMTIGQRFNGNAASVVSGPLLGESSNFSFELTVSPSDSIVLKAASQTGVAGTSGQHYALSPLQGAAAWGSAAHAGLGLSVGVNGISVYQHSSNLLSSLLTWSGTVTANTHVAVNVIDNRPTLYINNELVATGLQSTKLLHPPTEVGGISWGYFSGSIHDVRVWNEAFLWQAGGSPDMHPQYEAVALSISENAAAGSVVTRLRSTDIDTGDTLTYSLVQDGGGLFQINATTGEVFLAAGAVPDHETTPEVVLVARVTDAGGLYREQSLTIRIADINEAPTSQGGEATMNEDNQVRLAITRVADVVINGENVPAVRIDTLPAGGQLTLDGQPVTAGQVMPASDAVRMVFKPVLFSTAAFNMNDVDAGDSLSAVRITALPDPAHGRLMLNGVEVSQETSVVHAHDFSQLTFEPARNFNGHASFTYRVIDSHGVQQGGEASTFTIHVNPVNDAPVIAPTLVIDVQEGTATRLGGLSFDDVDAGNSEITVKLHVEEGSLSAIPTTDVSVEGSGTQQLVLRGTRQELNQFLNQEPGVHYQSIHHEAPIVSASVERISPEGVEDPIVRLTFSTNGGSYEAASANGITLTGNNTQNLWVEGLASQVGPYVTAGGVVRKVPIQIERLTMTVNDEGHAGIDPGLTGGETSEQDVRVIGLSLVPQGLPLNMPEMETESAGNAAGPEATGSASATTVAGVGVGTSLVLALGLFDKIKNVFNAGTTEEVAASANWATSEVGESAHILRGDVRHHWKEFVKWVTEPPVLPPGEPIPPITPPPSAPFPVPAIPGIVGIFAFITSLIGASNFHGDSAPTPQTNHTPMADGPDSPIAGWENQAVDITGVSFSDVDAGDATVRVTFVAAEGTGVLAANAADGVQVLSNFSRSLTLLGTVTAINAFIATGAVQFLPANNVNGLIEVDVTINDMGNTGTDPGTSGDAFSEESSIVVQLQLTPVSDAPQGNDSTVQVTYDSSLVLGPERFGFSDVDGDEFTGIRITELPDSGQLLLDGVPVVVNQEISSQDLANMLLVYVPDAMLSGPPVHPRIGFLVKDSGSTEHGGENVSEDVNHLSLQVQYPLLLTLGGSSIAFNEAVDPSVKLLSDIQLDDRSTISAGFTTVKIQATGLEFGDRWQFDQALLSGLNSAERQTFQRVDLENGLSKIEFEYASLDVINRVLDAIVFDIDAPNATEGSRQFTITVTEHDDTASDPFGTIWRESEPVVVTVAVTSILGDLGRTVEARQAAMQARADAGPLPPTADVAAADAQASWALLQARAALAQAVAQALSEAIPTSDGGLQMGISLELALRTLGLGQGSSLVFNITNPTGEELGGDWLSHLIRDPATNTLWMPGEQRLALLAWAEGQRAEALQWAAAQLMASIDSPTALSSGGENAPAAWKLPAGAWLLGALAQAMDPAWEPNVVQGNDPWAVWSTSPHAWVQDVEGNLYLNNAAWRQLKMATEIQLALHQDDSGSPELLAMQALQSAAAMQDHWLVDARLLGWLAAADVSVSVLPDNGGSDRPWLTQPGVVVQTAEGLRMAPPTLMDLQERLLVQLDKAGADATPAQRLFAALQSLIDSEAEPTLPAEARHWLDSLGLGVRWVTDLSAGARPGEIAQSGAGAPLALSAATVEALSARLLAREAADALQGAGSVAAGPVGSDLLQVKRALEQAQTSQLSDKLHAIDADEVVVAWLQASGHSVVSTAGYQALSMNDALARLMDRPNVAIFEPLTNTLHLSDAVYRRLGAVAGVALESALNIEPAEIGPLAPSPSTPTVETRHADAVKPGAGDLTPAELAQLWFASMAAINMLVGPGNAGSPILAEAAPTGVRLISDPFTANAIEVLAKAGMAVADLGDWNALSTTERAALSNAGQPALARDAFGQPFMDESVIGALQNRLLAQAFGERAELALEAIRLLAAAPDNRSLPVIHENGWVSTKTSSLPYTDPTDLVVTLTRADLLRLQHLGLKPANVEVVDGYLNAGQLDALQHQPGLVVVDQRRGTVWIHEETRESWLQSLADTMQASRVARYTIDPASIESSGHAGQPVGMAYAVSLTGSAAVEWSASPVGDDLVRVSLDVGTLLAARLAFRTTHADSSNPATLGALAHAQTGTVMTDAAHPGNVFMTTETWSALLAQSARIGESVADWSNGVPDAAAPLLTALMGRTVLEDAFDDDSSGFVWMNHHSALLGALQAAGIATTPVSFGTSNEPPSSLIDQLNTYALTGDRLVASEATWQAWRAAVLAHANQLGAPAYEDAPWQSAVPAAMHDTQTTSSAAADALESAQTQLAALLVDARRESITIDQQTHSLWHLQPIDQRLDAAVMRFILQESDAAFQWHNMPAGDNSSLSNLLSGSYPTVVEAADGSLYFTGAGMESAVEALRARIDGERETLVDRLQHQLLQARTGGGRALLPADAVPGDWQVLLGDSAPRLRLGSSNPEPGELAIDSQGRLWLHESTQLRLLDELGEHQPNAESAASTLLAMLNNASTVTQAFGVWSINGDALALLQSLKVGSKLTGLFDGTAIGIQNLGEASVGSYLPGADARLYVTSSTLAALRALAQGRADAPAAATDQTTIAEVALLNYLSELSDHTLRSLQPAPVAGLPGDMSSAALWQHLKHWIVIEGPGSQTTGLQDQVGLPSNWLDVLQAAAPVRLLTIGSDNALLAALQGGDLRHEHVIVKDAAGNHLLSPATRGLVMEWIANGLTHSTGMDWSAQYGLEATLANVEQASSKRALMDQQQTGATDPQLYADSGAVLTAVLTAQDSAQGNGTHSAVRINLTAQALTSWLEAIDQRGLHDLNLAEVLDPEQVADGQFAEDGTGVVLTAATASRLFNAAISATHALARDNADKLLQQISSREGYNVVNGFIVVEASEAFDVWRQSTTRFNLTQARDVDGAWHEVAFEPLKAVQQAYFDALAAGNLTEFLESATNLTLVNNSTVALRNTDLIAAYDQLTERGQGFSRNADGNWVMSDDTREWVITEAATLGTGARMWQADQLADQLSFALGHPDGNDTISLNKADALALFDQLDIPYLLSLDPADVTLSHRVIDMGDNTVLLSTDTGGMFAALAANARNDGLGIVQQRLATLNDAAPLYNEAQFVARLADVDLLPSIARHGNDPAKLLVSIALDEAVWARFGLGDAGSTSLPVEGPLSAASQTDWDALWSVGSVRAYTDASGAVRYLMTSETWSTLLEEVGSANPGGSLTAVVRLSADDVNGVDLASIGGLTVVALTDLPGAQGSELLHFAGASALVQELPAHTALRDADGNLWMSTNTANAAKAVLRGQLNAASLGLDTPTMDSASLGAQLAALDLAREGLSLAKAAQVFNGGTWSGHALTQADLSDLELLGLPLQQVSGTDPSALTFAPVLGYVVDAQDRVWVSAASYGKIATLVDATGHALGTELHALRWQAVPGQGLWTLSSDSHFDLLLQRSPLSLVDGGAINATTDLTQLAQGSFVRDAQGRVYMNDATHTQVLEAVEQVALAERAQFQNSVQASLMASTVDTPPTLVFINDNDLQWRIVQNTLAERVSITTDLQELSAADRKALAAPSKYAYAEVNGGMLIGLNQLQALASLTAGGIGEVNASQYTVQEVPSVVVNREPMLADWLVQLGYRFGSIVDAQGNTVPSGQLSIDTLSDVQRAQLNQEAGLIVRGANGQLLMSDATWQAVSARSMTESNTAQSALALDVQKALGTATLLDVGGDKVATLSGDAKAWLAQFDSLGMAYHLVDALGTPTDVDALNPKALVTSGNTLPVGIDSQGRLVMSEATLQRLSDWSGEFANFYSLNSALLQAQGAAPGEITNSALNVADTQKYLLGDWQGATAGVRLMYSTITSIRSVMNFNMAADGVVKGNFESILKKWVEFDSAKLSSFVAPEEPPKPA
ncbi:VCBS domain-containing protein [Hydrogenophaga sp.]|uniref:VCBS domain-containing protein n=1 Tax=Hydrogenophaga sp. TaxID=1904254 RepID=UPI0027314D1E|nr:VCBS domain-containing protein [Hydrogenophaga sp.]MDP2076054.1 VCBS domain-containing protein [Hydrogenophaga sp.]MDP3106629.1 VCBS domain-containing protein [Hydrogenophaga sp.]